MRQSKHLLRNILRPVEAREYTFISVWVQHNYVFVCGLIGCGMAANTNHLPCSPLRANDGKPPIRFYTCRCTRVHICYTVTAGRAARGRSVCNSGGKHNDSRLNSDGGKQTLEEAAHLGFNKLWMFLQNPHLSNSLESLSRVLMQQILLFIIGSGSIQHGTNHLVLNSQVCFEGLHAAVYVFIKMCVVSAG